MPLLALGLGVDDMFVLIRYFSDLGVDFITARPLEDIIGEVFAEAGPGTTLSSVCNIITFAVGAFFPIPAMADFCLGAVFVSLMNYLVMMNLFLPLMTVEIFRVKARRAELHPVTYFFHRRAAPAMQGASGQDAVVATNSSTYNWGFEKSVLRILETRYAPLMMLPAMRLVVLLVTILLLLLSVAMIRGKELGYGPWDLFETGSMESRSLELIFTAFSLFPARLIFEHIDVANNQAEMVKLYDSVIEGEYAVAGAVPNYVTGITVLGSDTGTILCAPLGTLVCDMTYRDPQLAPLGLVPADKFDEYFNQWRQLPTNPAVAWAKTGFMYADMVGAQKFDYRTEDGVEKVSWSFFDYTYRFPFVDGRNNENVFIDAIQHTKDAIAASPIKDKVVAYGPILVFWEVFLDLGTRLNSLIGTGLAIIFVVTLVLSSLDLPVALITCISCALIVTQVYGIAAYFLNFNIFVAALVLFGLGMAVEFTAHFATAFSNQAGNDDHTQRLGIAMVHTFPAVFEGSLSTLVSILPLAFASNQFTVKYLFGVIALVVVVGLFNGLFLMPGLISVLSPLIRIMETNCCRKVLAPKDIESGEKRDAAPASPGPAYAMPAIVEASAPPAAKKADKDIGEDTDNEPIGAVSPAAPVKETAVSASNGSASPSTLEKEDEALNGNEQAADVGVVKQVGDRLKCSL